MDLQQRAEVDTEFVGSQGIIKKTEFIKIIEAALYSLGYEKTGSSLQEESGISLHSTTVNLFKQQILDGQWDESLTTLTEVGLTDETVMNLAYSVILECKYFEHLAGEKFMDALNTLRNEIVPACMNDDKVRKLSSFILSPSLKLPHGTFDKESRCLSRGKILEKLATLFPPSVLFSENRLVSLVEQAFCLQIEKCKSRNIPYENMSLLTDQHNHGVDQIPDRTMQVLQGHAGEVWFLTFSHDGKKLASSGSDSRAVIWEVTVDGNFHMRHVLSGHKKPVSSISWSPDDTQLLTCSAEEAVRRWNVTSGACIREYRINGSEFALCPVSCDWNPDGKSLYAGLDDNSIVKWDLDRTMAEVLPRPCKTKRIADLCITSDGKELITVCDDNTILLFGFGSNSVRHIEENQPIVSLTLSKDNKRLLVSLLNEELHVWNIRSDNTRLLAKFKGHRRSRFVVRSCFGGVSERYIASGSEDSQVYIWENLLQAPKATLSGHSGAVNCVSWSPVDHRLLASGSDDGTIRIWGVGVPVQHPMTRRANLFFLEEPTS